MTQGREHLTFVFLIGRKSNSISPYCDFMITWKEIT